MSKHSIPRRTDQTRWTEAEHTIQQAVWMVEAMGAHERLTRAVILLAEARNAVADFVDGVSTPKPTPSPTRRSDFAITDWLNHWATELADGLPLTEGARELLVEDLREARAALERQGDGVVRTTLRDQAQVQQNDEVFRERRARMLAERDAIPTPEAK